MTEPHVVEKIPEEVSVRSTPIPGTSISVIDMSAVVNLFGTMLDRQTNSIVDRFAVIERRVDHLEKDVSDHHRVDHDRRVAINARVEPVRTLLQTVVKNWRTIALVALFLMTAFIELVVGFAERVKP